LPDGHGWVCTRCGTVQSSRTGIGWRDRSTKHDSGRRGVHGHRPWRSSGRT
jgi:hypothetical protein